MPGWIKVKLPFGQPATEPVSVQTKVDHTGTEKPTPVDADGDVVTGGTWGTTTSSSPFPTSTVPAGEATTQQVFDLLKKVAAELGVE